MSCLKIRQFALERAKFRKFRALTTALLDAGGGKFAPKGNWVPLSMGSTNKKINYKETVRKEGPGMATGSQSVQHCSNKLLFLRAQT